MHTRKADQVADELLQQIVWRKFLPGDTLPKESELAESFGVNRSVIREALRALEVHRLVQPIKRKGTIVLDPSLSLSPPVLRAMLIDEAGQINVAVLRNILEIRKSLDVTMAELAAKHRSLEQVAELRARLRALESAFDSPAVYEAEMCALVLVVARASRNQIFEMLVHWHESVSYDLGHLMAAVRQPSQPHVQGLATLIDVIEAQDSDAAGALVRAFHGFATPLLIQEANKRNNSRKQELVSAR